MGAAKRKEAPISAAKVGKKQKIVDAQGNAVSSDTSIVDPSTIYTVGSAIIATEYLNSPSRQPIRNFFSPGDTYGLYGFMSKIEAAVYAPFSGCPIMNLTALGL